MSDRDAQMASEYAAGREIPEIAARYDVPVAYVKRVIEEAAAAPLQPVRSRWSLGYQGNRALLALVLGWLAWRASGALTVWTFVLVAVVVYTAISVVIGLRRR
ncbi:hypothetical protein [Actinoplanes teichomyceticus]|nr:hypothetical protein [Actinoplanes teichomyceticus]